ncbi:hypothetical protein [Algivirga pacifica]|uniref:DUF5723 domain-containing protein n=1 Tax=Algivirga pacifica TaxID=1162670 RepID=A0ABP9CY17_9BACT
MKKFILLFGLINLWSTFLWAQEPEDSEVASLLTFVPDTSKQDPFVSFLVNNSLDEAPPKKWIVTQVSLVPGLSTDNLLMGKKPWKTTHHYSLNLLFGINGGLQGMELGGLGNVLRMPSSGFMTAGGANITQSRFYGVQAAPVNIGIGKFSGTQLGLTNLLTSEGKGAQLGVVNLATDSLKGVQVACLNMGRYIKGVQVGILNIADEVDGASIGILSIVKKGYRSMEVSNTSTYDVLATYRMGGGDIYNLFSLGYQEQSGYKRYALGYGIGYHKFIDRKNRFFAEASAFHINEDELWTNGLNLVSKVNVGLELRLFPWVAVAVSPSLNVLTSQFYGAHPLTEGTPPLYRTNTLFEKQYTATNVQIWAGYQVGLRFGRLGEKVISKR